MIHQFVLDRPYRAGDFIRHELTGFDPAIEWSRVDAEGSIALPEAQEWLDSKGYKLPLSEAQYLEFTLVFG